MSDDSSTGSVRRFGRKDRKRELETRGPLFPPDADTPEPFALERAAAEAADEIRPVSSAPTVQPAHQLARAAATQRRGSGKQVLANLLTVVFLLGTIGAGWVIATIASNPYTPLNPFPPFTPLPIIITATFLPATATTAGTAAPTATFTPVALDTSNTGEFAFKLQPEQPIYAPNANTEGCNWSSIAGTVTTAEGTALDGYRIHISGNGLDETVFSGAAVTFGAGGFELFLNGTPQAQTYTVELLDPQQQPLSAAYRISTRSGCDENVAILSFVGS